MNDINFEELDKAVSSALNTTKPATPSDEPPTAASDTPVAQASSAQSHDFTPKKRRGQFMDMVHPSSDMTSKTTASPTIRHNGQMLTPLSPAIVEADAGKMPEEVAGPEQHFSSGSANVNETSSSHPDELTHSQEALEAEDTPQADAPAVVSEWPDPLDLMVETETAPEAPAEPADNTETTLADEGDSEDDAAQEAAFDEVLARTLEDTQDGQSEPMGTPESSHESPFIDSVDVEKRPLGAFTDATAEQPDDAVEESLNEDEPFPDEIEESAPEGVTTEDEAEKAAEETTDEVVETDFTESTDPPIAAEQEATPIAASLGAASIIPQYKVAETAVDTEEHAVFDTAQYHQPLLPERTKSHHTGLWYTLLMVLMLGLGAAIGYAIFILKLI